MFKFAELRTRKILSQIMAARLALPLHPFKEALNVHINELHQMQMNAIAAINDCSKQQMQRQREIEKTRENINTCFNQIYAALNSKHSELLQQLDHFQSCDKSEQHSQLSTITTLLNQQKQSLLHYNSLASQSSINCDSLLSNLNHINAEFGEFKLKYQECMNDIMQSESTSHLQLRINDVRQRKILTDIGKLCSAPQQHVQTREDEKPEELVVVDDTKSTDSVEIQMSPATKITDALEEKVRDLESKLTRQREVYQQLSTDTLKKINKYLVMEETRGIYWYDANALTPREHQNWEPLYVALREGFHIDSKGKYQRVVPQEHLLHTIPDCANLGEFHLCITKLKNGYTKWIQQIAARYHRKVNAAESAMAGGGDTESVASESKKSKKAKGNKKGKKAKTNTTAVKYVPKKKVNAETFIFEFAQNHQLSAPQIKYEKIDQANGGGVTAKLSFARQVFVAEARKKKAARDMCYEAAMQFVTQS